MKAKLNEITTKYHTFVENQVLTNEQLNEFINYFDDQDRLSRILLSGVGIACGFKLAFKSGKIYIAPGVGVTTDGDLIALKINRKGSLKKQLATTALPFAYFRKFKDDAASYDPFKRLVGIGRLSSKKIDLYELFPTAVEGSTKLSSFSNLKEMVVLLYLESYALKGDLCTAIDCDSQGIEQVNRLRVLLLNENDAQYLANNDSIYAGHNNTKAYLDLPALAVRKVVLNEVNSTKYDELKRAYYDAVKSDGLVDNLCIGITKIQNSFGVILDGGSVRISQLIAQLKSHFAFSPYLVPFDIQYRYDFLKDLTDNYNELKTCLLKLNEVCIPDIEAFPKHLLLGKLSEVNTDLKNFRHRFYPSPALGVWATEMEKAKSLYARLLLLITNYSPAKGELKITPSQKNVPGKQSIPFYYKVDRAFLKAWNYEQTNNFSEEENLSYHATTYSKLSHIIEPLAYTSSQHDFLRIEGHQGKDYRDVLEELEELKLKYGLGFDVKALSVNINTSNIDLEDYSCEFEDLSVMLKAWRAEQDCVLAQVSDFFSGFSTEVPGTNIKEPELSLKKDAMIGATLTSRTELLKEKLSEADYSVYNRALVYSLKTKNRASAVTDNLVTAENTIGEAMKIAIEANIGGSVNDIVATAGNALQEKVNTDAWNADPELKEFVVNKSVELMAGSYVLSQRMPLAINEVDTDKLTDYKLSLSQLCKLVQKLKASYNSTQLSTQLRAFTGLLINQLSAVCCSGKKLEVLLAEVNKRKEQILLQKQLSKFIEQHPGLEHKAGVEPGGTFVIVYKNAEKTDNVSLGDKLSAVDTKADFSAMLKKTVASDILNIEKLSFNDRTSLLKATTGMLKYENYRTNLERIETLEKFIPVSKVPNNTVVADFALPYQCCSDCAPINYIIQKPPVKLRLSDDNYCLQSDKDPIILDVSPVDGIVQLSPVVPGIQIEGKKLFVSSESFPEEMIARPLKFTVNGQLTDAELTVYRGIEADFDVPEEPTELAVHTFVPRGDLEGASFYWDFGDGNYSTEKSPTHKYSLPVNDKNKVTVTLSVTAANKVCKSTVKHYITFIETQPTIEITPVNFCENDKQAYPFTVIPENAKVEIQGDGVERDANGTFVFIPAASAGGTIEFLVNGQNSGCKVTIHKAPKASFKPLQDKNNLVLNNLSANASQFEWSINGTIKKQSTTEPVIIELTPNSPTDWKLALTAYGADVCPPASSRTTFQTKYIEEPAEATCVEEAKAAILTDQRLLQKITLEDGSILAKYLVATQRIYGGTRLYNQGVLNTVDAWLAGKENERLTTFFANLLNDTAMMVVEMQQQKEIAAQFLQLVEYQLRLFYNVLGCQSVEVLKKYEPVIAPLLNQIVELLQLLQKHEFMLSDAAKSYMKSYAQRVEKTAILLTHVKLLYDKKLI
ncbi:hypothetical protein [uncultured Draconibacterium sp.]|uniref:PKD domain-containing protein n=1 Tax=uncultured Draconibacterium sp. TaxID=1573823 RepID=UPI00325FECF5